MAEGSAALTIIVPTYREVENLPLLIERVDALRAQVGAPVELLIVDDDSRDGTVELVARLQQPWVQLIVRTTNRGLSPAVLAGLDAARHDLIVVMDADLSHPPEKIPEMLAALHGGADFVIGSRYVPGAATDESWGLFRWLNSKVATLLARPFTNARDPMSGFVCFRKSALKDRAGLNPVGYKIGLELLVKGHFRRIVEVPIHFANRYRGTSKLTLREQLRYLQHLGRLFAYKFLGRRHVAPAGAP